MPAIDSSVSRRTLNEARGGTSVRQGYTYGKAIRPVEHQHARRRLKDPFGPREQDDGPSDCDTAEVSIRSCATGALLVFPQGIGDGNRPSLIARAERRSASSAAVPRLRRSATPPGAIVGTRVRLNGDNGNRPSRIHRRSARRAAAEQRRLPQWHLYACRLSDPDPRHRGKFAA